MRIPAANFQRGAALIVSLIILAVITLLGVAGMQDSGLQNKLSATSRDRAMAFEAAEAAIKAAEANLIASPPSRTKYFDSCTGDGCYSSTCTDGLCFYGSFSGATIEDCTLGTTNPINNESAIWKTSAKDKPYEHKFYVDGDGNDVKTNVAYVVEFACFTPKQGQNTLKVSGQAAKAEDYASVLRVSAQAKGPANRATVTLQTTLRLND